MKHLTLKNVMVYDYFRKKLELNYSSVKTVYASNKDDIEARFQIKSYNSFRIHVKKGIDYERQYGNSKIKEIVEGL